MPGKPAATNVSPLALGIARLGLVVAILVDAYLIWVALSGGTVAGCGPDSGCDQVLHSRWSRWLGVPVSAPALVIAVTMLLLTFRLSDRASPSVQTNTWTWLFPGAVLILGAALWFTALQAFVLHSFCPFCLTAHGGGALASIVLLMSAPRGRAPEKSGRKEKPVVALTVPASKLVGVACAGLAGLIAGQLLVRPKTFVMTPVAAVPSASAPATNTASSPGAIPPPALLSTATPAVVPAAGPREFALMDGRFKFKLDEVPLWGSPSAPHVVVSLFDYTCHHCRIMHAHLLEGFRTFSNELAIVSLPMPLDSQCNPTVPRTAGPHVNACNYARLGLAVWRARPAAQAQFDDWIFTPEHPPSIQETLMYALALVGTNELALAMRDPWIETQLQQDIAVYATNYYHGRVGNMPQLIVGTNVVGGTFDNVNEFYRVLEREFGLKAPTK